MNRGRGLFALYCEGGRMIRPFITSAFHSLIILVTRLLTGMPGLFLTVVTRKMVPTPLLTPSRELELAIASILHACLRATRLSIYVLDVNFQIFRRFPNHRIFHDSRSGRGRHSRNYESCFILLRTSPGYIDTWWCHCGELNTIYCIKKKHSIIVILK